MDGIPPELANAIALLGGNAAIWGALAWFLWTRVRNAFKQHVADPLSDLKASVDKLASSDIALKQEIAGVRELAANAHTRIDLLMVKGKNSA